jgi:hypothetical protein
MSAGSDSSNCAIAANGDLKALVSYEIGEHAISLRLSRPAGRPPLTTEGSPEYKLPVHEAGPSANAKVEGTASDLFRSFSASGQNVEARWRLSG